MGHLKLSLAAGLPMFGRIVAGRRARFLPSTEMALLRRSTTFRADTTREGRQSKDATSSMWIGSRASEATASHIGHVLIEPVPTALCKNSPGAAFA